MAINLNVTRTDLSEYDATLLLGFKGDTGQTAYEYAVDHGYEGTENDFGILMASYATVAEAAAESAQEAQSWAEAAESSADAASDSATDAASSATAAASSASSAGGAASYAGQQASNAESSATRAANSQTIAAACETAAANSASSAEQSKQAAAVSATLAGQSATSAEADADRAEAALTEFTEVTATATTLPAGSSATAEYDDGELTLGIPKGDKGDTGDTGNGIESVTLTSTSGAVKTYTILFTDGTTTTFNVTDGEVTQAVLDETVADLKSNLLDIYPTDSADGDIASFADGADDVSMKSFKVAIEPVQEGSGDPSPTNVRPISGWDSVKSFVTAENIFGGTLLCDGVQASMPSATDYPEDGYIEFSSGASTEQYISYSIKFKENTQYTFVMTLYKASGTGTNLGVSYTDGTNDIYPAVSATGAKETVVFVSDAGKTIKAFYKRNSSGRTRIYYNESGVFEGVLTADDFKAYNGQTYTTNLGQTVYGGTLDVVTGELTIEYTTRKFLSSEYWALNSGIKGFVKAVGMKSGTHYSDSRVVCSAFEKLPANSAECGVTVGNDNASVYFRNVDLIGITTSAEWKTFLDNTDVTVTVPKAEPTTVQLTPQEVKSLLGANNVWADAGSVSVKYRADVGLYVDKEKEAVRAEYDGMIAPTEASFTATQNYTTGSLLIVDGTLYKVTANIANGGTITPNTNVTATTLAEVIASL